MIAVDFQLEDNIVYRITVTWGSPVIFNAEVVVEIAAIAIPTPLVRYGFTAVVEVAIEIGVNTYV